MLVGEFFTSLAKQAGIAEEDENLKKLTDIKELATATMPEDLAKSINSALLTVDSAKSNPDLIRHFKAETLNGLDTKITGLMDSLSFNEDQKKRISDETNSFEKVAILSTILGEMKDQAVNAAQGDAGSKDEQVEKLREQVNGLNKQLSDITSSHVPKTQLDEAVQNAQNQLMGVTLANVFAGYDYASPASKEASVETAKALFSQELNSLGYKVNFDNGALNVLNSEGAEAFDDKNQKVTVKSLADTVLAKHNMLKVNDPNAQVQPNQQQQNQQQPNQQTVQTQQTGNDAFAAKAEALANEHSKILEQ